MKTVVGVFDSREGAEKAVNSLRESGFDREISIVAKDEEKNRDGGNERHDENSVMFGGDSVADGATTGGVLGGLAGLAIGAGALAIPGLGPIIAAGPVAGLLSGAASGGIAGGLVDWGIPEAEGRQYEENLKQGNILAIVRADDKKIDEAAKILENNGANRVGTHGDQ